MPTNHSSAPRVSGWRPTGRRDTGAAGSTARFADVRVGDKLRTKTHGRGMGAARICWEIFLDDQSLLKFQAEQQAVHAARMAKDGMPGYVDLQQGRGLDLPSFARPVRSSANSKSASRPVLRQRASVARPAARASAGKLTEIKPVAGALTQVTLLLDSAAEAPGPQALARLWAG